MSDKPVKFDSDKVATEQIEAKLDESVLRDDFLQSQTKQLPSNLAEVKLKYLKKTSKLSKWFWVSFALLVFVGASYEAWQLIQSMFAINGVLGWVVSGLVAITLIAGFGSLIKGRIKSKRLNKRLSLRTKLTSLLTGDTYGQAQPLINEVNEELQQELDIAQPIAKYQQIKQDSHNDRELLQIYSDQVLSGVDKLALEVISKHASESAAMVALSPLAAADMALVAWRSSKMLQEVSRIYGCPQNVFGRLGLTKKVATNLMLAGASELVADAGVELLGKGLAATISGKVAQGIGIGILISRLGIQTMILCRPMEFTPENKPKLSQLRKLISSKVLSMVGMSNKESNKAKDKVLNQGEQDD